MGSGVERTVRRTLESANRLHDPVAQSLVGLAVPAADILRSELP